MLLAMEHRGARGSEPETGDGAGIMVGLPHVFFETVVKGCFNRDLPKAGQYAVGMVFLPKELEARNLCKKQLEKYIELEGQKLIGWRVVPTDPDEAGVGKTALLREPFIEQVFLEAAPGIDREEFARKLYLIRKQAYHAILNSSSAIDDGYYMASFSESTIVYKGQLTPEQLPLYFPDLQHTLFATHLAVVHSRFSTNTFPSWERAQPMRYISHNGEINTLKGNVNWAKARESHMASGLFADQFQKLLPIIDPVTSDSGMFDNVLELLTLAGRSLPEAISMMMPEAWQSSTDIPGDVRAMLEYNSCLIEPWDGPAAITFADGRYAGAAIDRNGLRPCRFCVTVDGLVIISSEAGALQIPPASIIKKGRVAPGKALVIDFKQHRILSDQEVKKSLAESHPYQKWLKDGLIDLDAYVKPKAACDKVEGELYQRLTAFGYTHETTEFMLLPLVQEGRDPVGSMGCDTPIAPLSKEPKLVFDYLRQLFAQVTNPPIDSIREEIVMSLACPVGPESNLLDSTAENCRRLNLKHPILNCDETSALKSLRVNGWKTKVIGTTMCADSDLRQRLLQIALEAIAAVEEGYSFIVLSDKNVGPNKLHIPSLLACGTVHHQLIKKGLRSKVGLFVETGEAREVHHFCCLFGYGADGVHPYLAHDYLIELIALGKIKDSARGAIERYRKSLEKGILKVLAKLGISTLQSYKGAQTFEALGLSQEVVDFCLTGTSTRLSGHTFEDIKQALLRLSARGKESDNFLAGHGDYHWRHGGEEHMWNPATIASLQEAARSGDASAYTRFADEADRANAECTIRGMLKIRTGFEAVPVERVERELDIVKRFSTGAMSFGSISRESHETLAVAMNRIDGKSNTGEGGEDSGRWITDEFGDTRRSAIKQVASGRFGVTIEYLANADEIQIKMAQGAKPGEGGELPGAKVGDEIAKIRCSTPGVGLISPPPHHDIYSIEDLAQLIYDLKQANPLARISVKLVSEVGVGIVAAGVAKAGAHHILISGSDGGTGASPLTSIKNAGLPWELGLAEAHQTLCLNGLRNRVKVQADGQIKTGKDVAIAILLGADEIGFSTAPLIALGCLMMRKCHLNTCPVGIATQDPELRKKFTGQPEHVINYLFMVAAEFRDIMAGLGLKSVDDMVGRSELLEMVTDSEQAKRSKLDLSRVLERLHPHSKYTGKLGVGVVSHSKLNEEIALAVKQGNGAQTYKFRIHNTDRTIGTALSAEFVDGRAHGPIKLKFRGSAGQSLGAWLAKGITIELEGEANDYLGKGLSGGRIIVVPPRESLFRPEQSVIAGNAVLYGATSGEAFISGGCCERFAVRNSGASAVVEGVGDHGCEYMTRGQVVVLGNIGRNFAAGMSGGVAYVVNPKGTPVNRFNTGTVDLESIEDESELKDLYRLILRHRTLTNSMIADEILENWVEVSKEIIKVMPRDYKRVLAAQKQTKQKVAVG
jgi:glutamate synthase (NADPH/NADH) large chain